MNETEHAVLAALAELTASHPTHAASAQSIAAKAQVAQGTVFSVLERLAQDGLVALGKSETASAELTDEGLNAAVQGTPEARLAKALEKHKALAMDKIGDAADLTKPEEGIALQWGKRHGWLNVQKTATHTNLSINGDVKLPHDDLLKQLHVNPGVPIDDAQLAPLVSRGLVRVKTAKNISARLTPAGQQALKAGAKPTPASHKLEFIDKVKPYDAATLITHTRWAKNHAYKSFLDDVRARLVGLGFRELAAPLIESEFWNMDALYMAQDHPARDIHDVFHLKSPDAKHHGQKWTGDVPEKLFNAVREAHFNGGATGSKGWRYDMSLNISRQLIARSHDTGVSARELNKHHANPDKVFFFPSAFRPDEIDWKHMIEFEQLGGYVADENITIRELMGYLEAFAVQVCGATAVKFQPSYYPFTEPGIDMHVNLPGKGWMEVGGAGMFRPEMLEPLGVDVPVVAWGVGIGRLALFKLGLTDIRDLYSQDLQLLENTTYRPFNLALKSATTRDLT